MKSVLLLDQTVKRSRIRLVLVEVGAIALIPTITSNYCQKFLDCIVPTGKKVGESTVHRTRQRYVEEGIELAFKERPRQGRPQKLTFEAMLIATACSDEGLCRKKAKEMES